jgi:single-strand DNA-binding protein
MTTQSQFQVINLIGRLTTDPELANRSGTDVGRLRLAIQRPKHDGEDQGVDYVDVTVFNRQAQVSGEYLGKGRRVAAQGRLPHSEWTPEDGSKRQKLDVVANEVEFLDWPRESGSDEAGAGRSGAHRGDRVADAGRQDAHRRASRRSVTRKESAMRQRTSPPKLSSTPTTTPQSSRPPST